VKSRVSRREVLRGAFGAALALPWLEAYAPRAARAESGRPRRFIALFSANGTLPWAQGGERDFELLPILQPLAAHRDALVLLEGLNQQGGGGDAHQNGMGGLFTGTPLNSGPFGGIQAPPAGWASGPSVDQRIAEVHGVTTKLASLELGVQVGQADNWGRMCYRASNQPLPPEADPRAVYERVFAELHTDPALLAQRRARQQSILDAVQEEYRRVSRELGAADRARLDAHATAVREIEQRLTRPGSLDGAACADPVLGTLPDVDANDEYPRVGALQMDLLVMALACDVTRVASLQWSRSVSQTRFTWLGIQEAHHDLSHLGDDNASAVDKLTRINAWYATQLATLIDKLKAVPDGEGTLFDSTLILWGNDLAKGNTHSRNGARYVLAGSAGGALRTGRLLRFDAAPHNDLLVSVLHAMDVPDDTFGNADWCRGPLSGLI
jgi:hypothetical protein